MKLYLVRHTSAADFAASDEKRPLTRQGEEEARRVGAALARMNVRPSRVLSSPLLRAQQTAQIIARECQFADTIESTDALVNGASTQALLKVAPDNSILVGHMPSLAEHVAEIVGESDAAQFAFGKGSVACIDSEAGKLIWLKHLPELSTPR